MACKCKTRGYVKEPYFAPFLSCYLVKCMQVIVIPSRKACAGQSRQKSDLDLTPKKQNICFKILSKFGENFLHLWNSKFLKAKNWIFIRLSKIFFFTNNQTFLGFQNNVNQQ